MTIPRLPSYAAHRAIEPISSIERVTWDFARHTKCLWKPWGRTLSYRKPVERNARFGEEEKKKKKKKYTHWKR
jgi:hypothetical protein